MPINKESFVYIINSIQNSLKFEDMCNSTLHKNGATGYIGIPSCAESVIYLLHIMLENTNDHIISDFCYELDFGRKWSQGFAYDSSGNDIRLKTPEDLYNFLESNFDRQIEVE